MAKLDTVDLSKVTPKRRTFFNGDMTKLTENAGETTPALVETPVQTSEVATMVTNNEEIRGMVVQIHLDSLFAYEQQSRTHFDENEIKNLSQSIKANGIRTPLKVVRKGNGYQVVSGERRLRSAKLAGLDHAPCIIIEERQALIESVLENLQRENLNIFEEGRDYLKLLDSGMYQHQKEMADGLGVSMSRISEVVNFYKRIPSQDQERLIKENKVSRQHLRNFIEGKGTPIEKTPHFQLAINFRNDQAETKLNNLEKLSESDKESLVIELESVIKKIKGQ